MKYFRTHEALPIAIPARLAGHPFGWPSRAIRSVVGSKETEGGHAVIRQLKRLGYPRLVTVQQILQTRRRRGCLARRAGGTPPRGCRNGLSVFARERSDDEPPILTSYDTRA